jgi:hypothetical protein
MAVDTFAKTGASNTRLVALAVLLQTVALLAGATLVVTYDRLIDHLELVLSTRNFRLKGSWIFLQGSSDRVLSRNLDELNATSFLPLFKQSKQLQSSQ